MEKFFRNWKVWVVVEGIIAVLLIALGAYMRPGIDLAWELTTAVISPEPVKHISPKTDFENAVDAYFNSEAHQTRCMAMAQEQIAVQWAGKYLDIARKTGEKVQAYEIKAVNQISEKTATETVRIEKEAGRGK